MSGIPGVTHADPCTCGKCNAEANRVLAYGAIRRAVEVAREYDAEYDKAYLARDWDTCDRTSNGEPIRRAIRAAIGSDTA